MFSKLNNENLVFELFKMNGLLFNRIFLQILLNQRDFFNVRDHESDIILNVRFDALFVIWLIPKIHLPIFQAVLFNISCTSFRGQV